MGFSIDENTKSLIYPCKHFLKLGVLLVLIAVVSFGCGSGGGGGGGGGDNGNGVNIPDVDAPPIAYSGITNQAALNINNAAYMAIGGLDGGYPGTSNSGMSAAQVSMNIQSKPDRPRLLTLSRTLEETFHNMDFASRNGRIIAGAAYSEIQTEAGDCGGMLYKEINYDDSGNFSDTYTFDSFCKRDAIVGDVTFIGRVLYSGKYDIMARKYLQLNISFNTLYTSYQNDTFVTQGTIGYDYTVSPVTVTMDLLLDCTCDGKIYKYENYSMTLVDGSNYIDFEINGRFYDPDYGYVDISIITTFRIYDNDSWPDRGAFVFSGSSGTEGRFTILTTNDYAVEIDSDGDGFYDWSKIVRWDQDPGAGNPDQESPTTPTGLTAAQVAYGEISLLWNEPSDNIGVRGYKIYRDGTYLKTVTGTSTSDTGLSLNTQYCYSVSALDASVNESVQSVQACIVVGLFPGSGQSLGSAFSSDVSLGDLDGDGDIDVFAASDLGQSNKVWINTTQ